MKLLFQLEIEVTRPDGKKPRAVAQALAEQLFEFIDGHCKDEMFAVRDVDHALSVLHFKLMGELKRTKAKDTTR